MLITKFVFDMSISQGFEIDSLMEFHDLFDNFTSFLKQSSKSQKKNLVTPYVVFHNTFVEKGYFELLVLQKFKIQIDMRIVIGYSSVPNSKKKYQVSSWQNDNNKETYEDIYENKCIFPKTISAMLLLDGNYILEHNIISLDDISFKNILLIYIPNIWKYSPFDYARTVVAVNMYYERSPFKGRNNQKDPIRGKYKSTSHSFTAHREEKSLGNMVRYHHDNESDDALEAIRGIGDSIASAIWKQLDMFGDSIKFFFQNLFEPMACLAIGLEGFEAEVHQLQISKNSYIKPNIDKSDFEVSLIAWFTKENPKGGYFGIFQH